MVSLVVALNKVNIVAINAIVVLHVGKAGQPIVGRTPLGRIFPSPSEFHVPNAIVEFPKVSPNTMP